MSNLENEDLVKKENKFLVFFQNTNWAGVGKRLLFPHTVIVFFMFNITVAGLIYIFLNHYENSWIAGVFYAISFYTLLIVCARIPNIVMKVKNGAYANKYTRTYLTDKELRLRLSMYRGLLINSVFAIFKILLGFLYNSPWLFAMAGYNMLLSIMRFIVIYRSQKKGLTELEERRRGLQSYQVCGWLVMLLNIATSVIMYMVIVQKQTIEYHMIVTIGLAAFTFYCFIMAIINMVKFRERTNPVYATIKRIDMVKAIVSIFTLQVAMLTSFSGQGQSIDTGLMNTLTGVAVTVAINTIGAMMIYGVKKDFKEIEVNE